MRLSRKLDSVRGVSGDRHSYRDYKEKSLREYACSRNRHKVMTKTNPKEAGRLMQMAQETVDCCGLDYATPVDTGVEGGARRPARFLAVPESYQGMCTEN